MSTKTYGSTRAWWQHETQCHRVQRSWVCTPCKQIQLTSTFENSALFDEHIARHHPTLAPNQLDGIRDMCEMEVGKRPPRSLCPLCQATIRKTRGEGREREVERHVAHHLEQLAFFAAFPPGQMHEDDSEFKDDSDSEDESQRDTNLNASEDAHLNLDKVNAFLAEQERVASDLEPPLKPAASVSAEQTSRAVRGDHGVSENPQSGGGVVPSFPVFVQMPPPNEHFHPREPLLADVEASLRSPGMICVIYGVGGVGKTMAARQYSYTHKEHFDAVFWLQADTAPGLADSYLHMVMAVGLAHSGEDHDHVIAKGRHWLQQTGSDCPKID